MPRRVAVGVWVGIFGALGILDVWASRNEYEGDTLSEVTRDLFHVDTPAGKVALVGGWLGLSAWLLPHLIRGGSHRGLVRVVWSDTTK